MLKLITLKLTNVKHSGDPIGDDIRIDISVWNNFISIDKKVKNWESIACQDTVGQFFADGTIFNPEIKIAVIEKDLIYNDVGSVSAKLKINLDSAVSQLSAHKIEVYEKRGMSGHSQKRAVFEITLEANMVVPIGFVSETDDGWLVVKDEVGREFSLPSYLKVLLERRETEREFFVILEGVLRGRKASALYQPDGSSYFMVKNLPTPPVKTTYSISKKVLNLSGKKYQTTDYPDASWEKGSYDIEIPDAPHSGGSNYITVAPHAKVWFRVGHSGKRYIHIGRRSAGCITLIEQNRWEEVWSILVKARKGDGASVGVLEIVD